MHQREKFITACKWQFVLACCLLFLSPLAKAQTLPANFQRVLVTGGLNRPTVLAFTPDGRLLIGNQGGQLLVYKNGALLSTPALSLSVISDNERGLIGLAVDPNFATNKFIYIYYTHPTGPHNRVSRFTLNGDIAGNEVAILDLPTLGQPFHNGGSLTFGKDGKLYVGVGDNKINSTPQNLDSYFGKVLRINTDGSVPAGNPFTGGAARSRVWAYGLRNPWTSGTDPVSGKIYINEVGENAGSGWEEINDATTAGRNFGWPTYQGNCTNCPGVTNPVYTYPIERGSTVGRGCAINGGTFLDGSISNYPAQYHGKYFFHDYCNPWVDFINPAAGATRNGFGTALGGNLTNIEQGTDGNLYYISRNNNSVYKIVYTGAAASADNNAGVAPIKGNTEIPAVLVTTPNPFHNELSVTFRLTIPGKVQLTLFDLSGKPAGVILDSQLQAGEHRASYNTSSLNAGVYILKLTHDGKASSTKLIKE